VKRDAAAMTVGERLMIMIERKMRRAVHVYVVYVGRYANRGPIGFATCRFEKGPFTGPTKANSCMRKTYPDDPVQAHNRKSTTAQQTTARNTKVAAGIHVHSLIDKTSNWNEFRRIVEGEDLRFALDVLVELMEDTVAFPTATSID